jgi:uncharacterized protein (TIGR03067 family)
MKKAIAIFALLFFTFCGIAADAPAPDDQKDILGTWIVESASLDGRVIAPTDIFDTAEFAGDQLRLSDKKGKEKKGTFKLDTTKNPKVMLFPAEHAPNVLPVHWAYELNGDTLKLVNSAPNRPPTEMSDKGQLFVILKRKKP